MATPIEQIRALIADQSSPQHFTDDDLQIFLDLEDDNVFLAAADAADAWGSTLAASGQRLKSLDTELDTTKQGSSKFDLAKRLRARADEDGGVSVVEWVNDPWGAKERIYKSRIRGGG